MDEVARTELGGVLDRDQWTTILQIVSARTAYRHLYEGPLQPWLVADLLIFRREMPRSLVASAAETVEMLSALAARSGLQGPADRLADLLVEMGRSGLRFYP